MTIKAGHRPAFIVMILFCFIGDLEVAFQPQPGPQHSFVTIDHEIFSTVILSLPLTQEGQLPVSGERMCTILDSRLED